MRFLSSAASPRMARAAARAAAAALLATVLVASAVAWSAAQPAPPADDAADGAAGGADALLFRHLTTEQGLPSGLVFAVEQDALGFVWIGTSDGLGRYDGIDVREFRHGSDSATVAGNEVQALAAGPGGQMWVGTSDGLSRYDPAREVFETATGLPSANVLAVAADTAGGVWAGTDGGLARVEPGARAARAFRADPDDPAALPHDEVLSLLLDGPALWVGTVDGLARLDPATGRFRTFRPDSSASTSVSALARSERGTILVGTLGAGLFSFNPRTARFTPIDVGAGLLARGVSSIHEDADGTVWVGTVGGGLRQLTPGADGVAVHEASADNPDSIADNQVSDLMEDRQGILWAATYNGLDRFDRASGTAVRLRHDPADDASIGSNAVRAVLAAADGSLYVGTDRTLDRSADGRTFTHTAIAIPGGISTHPVSALYQDRAGTVWVGTEGAGFYRVGTGGALEKAPVQGEVGNLSVSAFLEDRDGRFWVGTIADGLTLYDRAAGTAQSLRSRSGQAGTLASNNVRALAQTADGALWVATVDGLCRMDRPGGGGTFTCPAPGNALVADELYALHAARDGGLWVGGREGLVHLDASGEVTRYTEAETDLPGDAVFAITADESGNLWLSTSGGLSQFDPVTEVFSNRLGEGDGGERTLGTAAARAADGRLYVGGTSGLLAFYPRQLTTKNPNPPQVVITGVDIFGEPVVPGPESELAEAAPVAREIRLAYDEEYVTFRFAGLHFSDPARNTYRFQLDGFDDTWRDGGERREATYTNLDPGRYTFRVQSANADGVWSPVGAALGVVVRPPWWRTIWAMIGFAGLAVVGLVRGERWQKSRLLRQERERAERREAELRAETAEAEAERQRAETAMLQAENSRAAAEVENAREVLEANTKLEAANTRLETSLVDLKATQSQLVQSEKLASLGQLTAGIAHEIKNPLNFVNNFAELSVDLAAELQAELEAGGTRPVADLMPDLAPLLDDLRDNARRIHEHGQRADRIVRAMLLHSRGGQVEHARVDLNRFVEEYANLAYHGARANDADLNVALVRDFDPDTGEAEVVPQELGRVLINLLTNAFHAVNERRQAAEPGYEPTVTIRTRRDGRAGSPAAHIVIGLDDNGPGIPADVLQRIFEPFFTTKPTGEGTGLGLSLAHDIVAQVHGGTLDVESEVGVGTRFTIRFPAGHTTESALGDGATAPPASGR